MVSVQRNRIEDRWSESVAEGGWSAVPNLFLDSYAELGLSPTEAMVIIHLMSFKWDDKLPFPSVATLKSKLGLSDSRLRVLLRGLEAKQVVERVRRKGRSNEYAFDGLISKLEQLKRSKKARERNSGQPETAGVSEYDTV